MDKCQYLGNFKETCCSNPTVENRSYCEDHVWLIYQKGTNLGKRKKDIRRANAVWDLVSEFNAALAELEAEGEL